MASIRVFLADGRQNWPKIRKKHCRFSQDAILWNMFAGSLSLSEFKKKFPTYFRIMTSQSCAFIRITYLRSKSIFYLCAPPAAAESIWAAWKWYLPRITDARTASISLGASATNCPARAANQPIPKLPGK
jgi:hypothetical protein